MGCAGLVGIDWFAVEGGAVWGEGAACDVQAARTCAASAALALVMFALANRTYRVTPCPFTYQAFRRATVA